MNRQLFFAAFLLFINCSEKEYSQDYSEILNINFPSDMKLMYSDGNYDFQDYTINTVYKLSYNQKNTFENELIGRICSEDEDFTNNSCWKKCDDYYAFKYNDEKTSILYTVIFIADNDISTIHIKEFKI